MILFLYLPPLVTYWSTPKAEICPNGSGRARAPAPQERPAAVTDGRNLSADARRRYLMRTFSSVFVRPTEAEPRSRTSLRHRRRQSVWQEHRSKATTAAPIVLSLARPSVLDDDSDEDSIGEPRTPMPT